MDPNKKMAVSFGSFACVLEGFDDPFPLMQDVVAYFGKRAAEGSTLGQHNSIADFDALAQMLRNRDGTEITLEPIAGGVYVRRIDMPAAAAVDETAPAMTLMPAGADAGPDDLAARDEDSLTNADYGEDPAELDAEPRPAADDDAAAEAQDGSDAAGSDDVDDAFLARLEAFDTADDTLDEHAEQVEEAADDLTEDMAENAPETLVREAIFGATEDMPADDRTESLQDETADGSSSDRAEVSLDGDADAPLDNDIDAPLSDSVDAPLSGDANAPLSGDTEDPLSIFSGRVSEDADASDQTTSNETASEDAAPAEPAPEAPALSIFGSGMEHHTEEPASLEDEAPEQSGAEAEPMEEADAQEPPATAEAQQTPEDDAPETPAPDLEDTPKDSAEPEDLAAAKAEEIPARDPAVEHAAIEAAVADVLMFENAQAPLEEEPEPASKPAAAALRLGPEMLKPVTDEPPASADDDTNETDDQMDDAPAAGFIDAVAQQPEARKLFRLEPQKPAAETPEVAAEPPAAEPGAPEGADTPAEGDAKPARRGLGALPLRNLLRRKPDAGSDDDGPVAEEPMAEEPAAKPGGARTLRVVESSPEPAASPAAAPEPAAAEAAEPKGRKSRSESADQAAQRISDRLHASYGKAPKAADFSLDDSEEQDLDTRSPRGFARKVGARELPELMAAAAAYLAMFEHKETVSRADIMGVIQTIAGDAKITAEAKVKAFGKLVRTGELLRLDASQFALSDEAADRFRARLAEADGDPIEDNDAPIEDAVNE
ncbi:MAG: hypothetical protein AAGE76_05115 [Pseudomonadota bacterium]